MLVLVVRFILLKKILVVDVGKWYFDVLLYAEKFNNNVYYRSNEISTEVFKIVKKSLVILIEIILFYIILLYHL